MIRVTEAMRQAFSSEGVIKAEGLLSPTLSTERGLEVSLRTGGTDVLGLTTRAERDGWVVRGQKLSTSSADDADAILEKNYGDYYVQMQFRSYRLPRKQRAFPTRMLLS